MSVDNFDASHANHEKTLTVNEEDELNKKKEMLLRESMQKLFNGYYYDHKK